MSNDTFFNPHVEYLCRVRYTYRRIAEAFNLQGIKPPREGVHRWHFTIICNLYKRHTRKAEEKPS